jgi:hypothetical protein
MAYILVLTASCLRCRASSRSRFGRGWAGPDFMNLASIFTFDFQVAGETHTLETLAHDRASVAGETHTLETLAHDRASMMANVHHKSFDPATNKRNFALDIRFLVGNAAHSPGRYGKLPGPA